MDINISELFKYGRNHDRLRSKFCYKNASYVVAIFACISTGDGTFVIFKLRAYGYHT